MNNSQSEQKSNYGQSEQKSNYGQSEQKSNYGQSEQKLNYGQKLKLEVNKYGQYNRERLRRVLKQRNADITWLISLYFEI